MLCEKYEFSASTLRCWKEQYDKTVYLELSKVGANGLKIFICILVSVLIVAVVFSKAAATFLFHFCYVFSAFILYAFERYLRGLLTKRK